MGLKFVGGPYDGIEIDHALINKHAQVVPVQGDVGDRLFVLLPDSPGVWARQVRGADVKPKRLIAYERFQSAGGVVFVESPPGAYDRALSEARLKVHPRARPALGVLSDDERRRVIEAADALQRESPTAWPDDQFIPFGGDEPLYLLRVTPDLRAIIRVVEEGQIELSDIVREETLQLFRDRK
jgi:hypothetical protein